MAQPSWTVEFLDDKIKASLDALPLDIQASFLRIATLIGSRGLLEVHEPYVKHLEGPVWEMRLKGRSGIARACYVTAIGMRVVVVHVFVKKTEKTPRRELEIALKKGLGGKMIRRYIPAEESFDEWRKNPAFMAEYDALEEEFALASALIEARANAKMTQEQVAEAMGTTQAAIARLEGGKIPPSTRTLKRFAEATNTRLRIHFEPLHKPAVKPAAKSA